MNAGRIAYEDFLHELCDSGRRTAVISSVNFEECSVHFLADLFSKCVVPGRVAFYPCRLESRKRTSPWSALELVKESHVNKLSECANAANVPLQPLKIQYPVTLDSSFSIMRRAAEHSPSDLVLDISAMPRALASFLCDIAFGLVDPFYAVRFERVFIVNTPPERVTGRDALGPFSVGVPRGVQRPDQFWRSTGVKTSALVFLGVEGFEARSCIDMLAGADTHTTVAIDCFNPSYSRALETMIANQSIVDDAFDNTVSLQYFFSEADSLRVAIETAERAVHLVREFPDRRHAFLVAPFGSKWSVAAGSLARAHYTQLVRQTALDSIAITDTLVFPRSQYVSLHSRGAIEPRVFEIGLCQ